ncbi:phytanoyl-CoA dioxygenase family protein [Pseudonocardia halophobica]|uniref:phytanoyl-CoA dioxygenase family protein n=1 Tax=Pseudonocardia halophobica TaxID=29401 RepID=UPI003D93143E
MTPTLMTGLDETLTLAPDTIAHYHEHGWTRVDQVIPREVALLLRERFLALEPEDKAAELEALDIEKQNYTSDPEYRKQHLIHRENSLTEEFTRVTRCRRVGSVVRQLLDVPEVQLFRTSLFEKKPESGGGGVTTLHQDYPYIPVDRSGSLTIWIALGDLPAETGTLQFVPGTHREGSLGRDRTFIKGYDRVTEMERKLEWKLSPAPSLRAGDATIHHDLTVHGAGVNASSDTRLGLATLYMDSRCLFTGAPSAVTEGMPLTLNSTFDTTLFPIIPSV